VVRDRFCQTLRGSSAERAPYTVRGELSSYSQVRCGAGRCGCGDAADLL
jgi:hypothetical protein